MNQISETDKAYAAGFFDGEGCIDIRYRTTHGGKYERFELRIHIPQISVGVLEWMRDKFGGTVDRHGGSKCSRWWMVGHDAARFLSLVRPYLRVKLDQANVAIEFDGTFDGGVKSKGRAGFQRVEPAVRQHRLDCFLMLRQIRKEGNVNPSGNRNPLSTQKAIRGLPPAQGTLVDNCGSPQSGQDGCLYQ